MPLCKDCNTAFEIHDDEKTFLKKMHFTFGKTEIHPPEPILCPQCRMMHRTCHRNERCYYKNKSFKSGIDLGSSRNNVGNQKSIPL